MADRNRFMAYSVVPAAPSMIRAPMELMVRNICFTSALEVNPIVIGTERPNSGELDGLQPTATREFLMVIGPVGLKHCRSDRVDVAIIRLIRLERLDVLAQCRFVPGRRLLHPYPQRQCFFLSRCRSVTHSWRGDILSIFAQQKLRDCTLIVGRERDRGIDGLGEEFPFARGKDLDLGLPVELGKKTIAFA
jgi:hypothetical protein